MGEVGGEERDCKVSGGGDGLEEHRLGLGTLIVDGGGKIFQEEQRQLHLCLCCVCECMHMCMCVCVVGGGGGGGGCQYACQSTVHKGSSKHPTFLCS